MNKEDTDVVRRLLSGRALWDVNRVLTIIDKSKTYKEAKYRLSEYPELTEISEILDNMLLKIYGGS